MTNLERTRLELKNIPLTDQEIDIYLQENSLNSNDEYVPTSNTNKRNILKVVLSILEGISNDVNAMKDYKAEDISVSHFHENLLARIDTLERKIRQLPDDSNNFQDGATFFYLFSE